MFMLTHFYYLGWPDHGVPEYATSILGFLRRVRKSHPISQSPLLVHCSAGVGRTGTFIVMDAILQQIHAEKTVNVYQFVQELRERRCQMVQTVVWTVITVASSPGGFFFSSKAEERELHPSALVEKSAWE